jgi:hypothetical protein
MAILGGVALTRLELRSPADTPSEA